MTGDVRTPPNPTTVHFGMAKPRHFDGLMPAIDWLLQQGAELASTANGFRITSINDLPYRITCDVDGLAAPAEKVAAIWYVRRKYWALKTSV